MIFLKRRSREKELLDLKKYTSDEYQDCLRQLGRIGQLLGGQKTFIRQIAKYTPQSILDIGCGGGDFAAHLAHVFPQAHIIGSDIDCEAIQYAQKKWAQIPNLSFVTKNIYDEEVKKYDIVTMTLVCHHVTDEELPQFLKKACDIAKKGVLINDLHRHPFAYWLFAFISPFLFPNRLIQHDGLLSIKRSFIRKDWKKYIPASETWSATRCWPFRWIVDVKV